MVELGSIGSGKTHGMNWLIQALRASSGPRDVFVVFDSKGDFLDNFYCEGDVVCGTLLAGSEFTKVHTQCGSRARRAGGGGAVL